MSAKILIADDEVDIVAMLGRFFESRGYTVLRAADGAETLRQAERRPDIILLDIGMPGMDGLEVCRRLNAAFAHELRTPLTVLKGYDELLKASGEAQTRETAETMGKHIARMERYIDGMSRLRRLEDAEPEYRTTPTKELAAALKAEAEMVCARFGKGCVFRDELKAETLCLDAPMVSEVFGNLIANAARYARESVRVLCAEEDGGLTVTVEDDGPGFSKRALRDAASPYFTEEGNGAEHFGLGLTICKILCERHGGRLTIENGTAGARVSAVFKCAEM